ncbi:DUF6339 family protein [Marinobacter sp. CA1]|uniref:DUF6339 family protein n=1 Tax=Marinobacter sp. CA1 TaxID=2817656 RepID=UPI001D07BD49|nr:DUF6339 family protein [Marinobacter sp. CA1]
MLLFPRLDRVQVDALLEEFELRETAPNHPNGMYARHFGATGGSRISDSALADLRRKILEIASENGFPNPSNSAQRSTFDAQLTAFFADYPNLNAGEALRDDVWAYITTVLVPDVVVWRFKGITRRRFQGGVRNALQRLWLRAKALDRGPKSEDRWKFVNALTEDAFVQIVERPSICSDSRLAQAIADGWIKIAQRVGKSAMEPVMRRAVVNLRLRGEIQVLFALDDTDLDSLVNRIFFKAASF